MKKLGLILFTVLTISVLAFALDGNGNGELNIFLGADISANEKVKQQDGSTVTENNAKKMVFSRGRMALSCFIQS